MCVCVCTCVWVVVVVCRREKGRQKSCGVDWDSLRRYSTSLLDEAGREKGEKAE